MTEKKIRIVIAKPGLDGHDRGAKVVARALRDAGMEVIYLGLQQTPEDIVNAAIQEDADFIGISSLAGAHMTHFKSVIELLDKNSANDICLVGGGIIPEEDRNTLLEMGVKSLFDPGTDTKDIIEMIKRIASEKHSIST